MRGLRTVCVCVCARAGGDGRERRRGGREAERLRASQSDRQRHVRQGHAGDTRTQRTQRRARSL
eukprot:5447460-Pleurochrysis_carterae.AAC.2